MIRPRGILPDPATDLGALIDFLRRGVPITFIRFSDGESEIIHGSITKISKGLTTFQGRSFSNEFPEWDSKTFHPEQHLSLRHDVLASAWFHNRRYFKGVLTSSNNRRAERFLMERWNRGDLSTLTFTDLLINSNYDRFKAEFWPLLVERKELVFFIANHRVQKTASDYKIIPVPDNAFDEYEKVKSTVMKQLVELPAGAIVCSSASSMSNVWGHALLLRRPDITFFDVGTSINPFLGLGESGRRYLENSNRKKCRKVISEFLYHDQKIRW